MPQIDALTDAELDEYERLLDLPDTDLLAWITGERPVPADIDSAAPAADHGVPRGP